MNTKSDKVQKIIVDIDHSGQRLDNFLLNFLKGVPKSKIYSIIRKGEVRVNSSRKKVSYKIVEKGSSLKLCSLADKEADIYPRFGPTSEWDIAAAHAVLNSHGGSVINIKNEMELEYAKESSILNPYFIAFKNNAIKNEFLPVLRDFFKKLV